MKIELSKIFGRSLIVAALTLTSVSGFVYHGTAIAGEKGEAASAAGAGNASGAGQANANSGSAAGGGKSSGRGNGGGGNGGGAEQY